MISSKLSSAFSVWKFSCNIPIFLSLSQPAGLEKGLFGLKFYCYFKLFLHALLNCTQLGARNGVTVSILPCKLVIDQSKQVEIGSP